MTQQENTPTECSKRPSSKAAASEDPRRYPPHFVGPFAIRMDLGERKSPYSASGLRKAPPQRGGSERCENAAAGLFQHSDLEIESGHGLHGKSPRSFHPATTARFRAFVRKSPSRTVSAPQREVERPRWHLARDRPTCTRPPAPAP